MTARLAVLGSPIGHSRSPLLHRAAYDALGLDWRYDAIEVRAGGLAEFVAGLDGSWRGLSLTMPLKREARPLLDAIDGVAELTGAVNTVVIDGRRRWGFNTDVDGIVRAFARSGVSALDSVTVLGGGATAASVLVAAQRLGATRAIVRVRDATRAGDLVALGGRLGVPVALAPLVADEHAPSAVVSTLPGGAPHELAFAPEVRAASVLLEVAYDPWPSALAASWLEVGGTVVDGLDMLVEQALLQVRAFVDWTPESPLPDESRVLAAMRASVAR
ncbi:shikimate dehydrogenase [Galbitalea sp. SE-J8]|uniref:shikimate dehydrogenase n=1 Tax=Galbitalea sp. SE-J8 TaxID=3054952 RepID=UPI00259CFC9A|nr:shikimate dehydrogenase [Galbitalea sp. SE-J8]MDM4763252.1 shikimate dehydrogenase [Galbitalea sp. SE-J8]